MRKSESFKSRSDTEPDFGPDSLKGEQGPGARFVMFL